MSHHPDLSPMHPAVALSAFFATPVDATAIPWHHQRGRDHDQLLHRTGPDFHRPGAFLAWARDSQRAPGALFAIDAVYATERLRLRAPAYLTFAFYDRGQLELRLYDSVHAYLQARRTSWTALSPAPRTHPPASRALPALGLGAATASSGAGSPRADEGRG